MRPRPRDGRAAGCAGPTTVQSAAAAFEISAIFVRERFETILLRREKLAALECCSCILQSPDSNLSSSLITLMRSM
jgi:hypothetical protein